MPSLPFLFLPILVGLLSGCTSESPAAPNEGPRESRATPVAGFEVVERDLSREVRLRGTIEALETVEIRSLLEGIVASIHVQEGDLVEPGERLLSLELSQLRGELNRARVQAQRVEQEVERLRPLAERGAALPAELSDLKAELAIAESEVSVIETRLRHGDIRAPSAGTITARHVHPGNGISNQELLLEIQDLDNLVVPFRVSERDVVHLQPQDPLTLQVEAYPGRDFTGSIRRIFPLADRESRRVTVEAAFDEIPEEIQLRPGNMVRTALNVEREARGLVVPTEALLASEGDDVFVYIVVDDRLERRDVRRGLSRRNFTEIPEGLKEGEIVVAMNPTNLREGMSVQITRWIE